MNDTRSVYEVVYPIDLALWAPIGTAPKDGLPVDLWAKTWDAKTDSFTYRRFPQCRWKDGFLPPVQPFWEGLDGGYYPVRWYRVPHPPVSVRD